MDKSFCLFFSKKKALLPAKDQVGDLLMPGVTGMTYFRANGRHIRSDERRWHHPWHQFCQT